MDASFFLGFFVGGAVTLMLLFIFACFYDAGGW